MAAVVDVQHNDTLYRYSVHSPELGFTLFFLSQRIFILLQQRHVQRPRTDSPLSSRVSFSGNHLFSRSNQCPHASSYSMAQHSRFLPKWACRNVRIKPPRTGITLQPRRLRTLFYSLLPGGEGACSPLGIKTPRGPAGKARRARAHRLCRRLPESAVSRKATSRAASHGTAGLAWRGEACGGFFPIPILRSSARPNKRVPLRLAAQRPTVAEKKPQLFADGSHGAYSRPSRRFAAERRSSESRFRILR